MTKRVFNFSPGPAMLPLPVLEAAQHDLVSLPGVGQSILEISHRSKDFVSIIETAESNLRKLLRIPDNYQVLFLQGGAQLQFAMIPMNFLRGSATAADYIVTGSWSKKAAPEAKTQGPVQIAFDGGGSNFNRVPSAGELSLNSAAPYAYFTSNETIQGVQFAAEPDVGDVPLVCDASSDILCRPVPIDKYALYYACAQKNAGPAGVTIVIIRDDMIEKCPGDLPSMLSYSVLAKEKSLLNTPPVFAVYVVKLVTDWLLDEIGGLDKMLEQNRMKSKLIYDVIDGSAGFYECHAEPESRSLMNIAFRLPGEALQDKFLAEAAKRDLVNLKGHRSVGGCRASIYNAMPVEGCRLLAEFMGEFQQANE